MMGTKLREFAPLPDLSLEEFVRKDNFYRRLEEKLDLSFVRELVAPLYAIGGRVSVDPVVFFKLQLILFFEDLRSERQLMEVVADRLSLRWYVGYDLYETLPDHSSLTKIRERYGVEVFREFFEKIVGMCIEAGLVKGRELFFDATKIEADADMDSLVPRWFVEAHLDSLFEEGDDQGGESEYNSESELSENEKSMPELPTAADEALIEANFASTDWISRNGRQDRSFSSGPRQRTSDSRASRTDPDASPTRFPNGSRKLGYQTHYVIDGGKSRIILDALVTPGEVTENRPMLDLLWHTAFRWKLHPHHVTGDGKYGTIENIAALEEAGIKAYLALHEAGGRGSDYFPKSEFTYDAEKDLYFCPAGETLRPTGDAEEHRRQGKTITYRARGPVCAACSLKPQCTINKNGRSLRRGPGDEYIDKVRAYMETEAYKKALRKRKVWIEPLFAEGKQWHRMRRFRLRTLEKVNTEALMIAAGQNLKRLLAAGPPKARSEPGQKKVALRLPPPSPSYEKRSSRGCFQRC